MTLNVAAVAVAAGVVAGAALTWVTAVEEGAARAPVAGAAVEAAWAVKAIAAVVAVAAVLAMG